MVGVRKALLDRRSPNCFLLRSATIKHIFVWAFNHYGETALRGLIGKVRHDLCCYDQLPRSPEHMPYYMMERHHFNTAYVAARVTKQLGMAVNWQFAALLGGLCHDLGKIETRHYGMMFLLNRRFTANEKMLKDMHPVHSVERLLCLEDVHTINILWMVYPIVGNHHGEQRIRQLGSPIVKDVCRYDRGTEPLQRTIRRVVSRADIYLARREKRDCDKPVLSHADMIKIMYDTVPMHSSRNELEMPVLYEKGDTQIIRAIDACFGTLNVDFERSISYQL